MDLTIDQALFDEILNKASDLGYDAYPTLPPSNVPYPFVRVGTVHRLPKRTKSRSQGKYAVSVDIWGIEQKRFEVSEMAGKLWQALSEFEIEGIYFGLDLGASSMRLELEEVHSKLKLWRVIMSLEIDIY